MERKKMKLSTGDKVVLIYRKISSIIENYEDQVRLGIFRDNSTLQDKIDEIYDVLFNRNSCSFIRNDLLNNSFFITRKDVEKLVTYNSNDFSRPAVALKRSLFNKSVFVDDDPTDENWISNCKCYFVQHILHFRTATYLRCPSIARRIIK